MKKRKVNEIGGGGADDANLSIWNDSNNDLSFMPLGSGREVGRSCHVLEFQGKSIMLDCGIHPGRTGDMLLPFFDNKDLSKIDICLISHFHLDHAASLPYLTEKTNFQGQIYMTSCTKAILRLVLKDYVRILATDPEQKPIYTQEQLSKCLERCQSIGFHQTLEIEGIKITPYHAGHVLGASMFLLEIAGVRILYTGDYSREDDRHLRGAEIPSIQPDVLIVESTFGVLVHENREEREKRFTNMVEKVVRRGGNCLIPMGALGAVQELLLILEDHWNKNPDLRSIPIYHSSRIANEALKVYKTFINVMNAEMRSRQLTDPWSFQNIGSLGENEEIVGPAVVLASPGYLQNGKSRKLFELWCSDRRNGVILAGYSVDGTLAKDLSREGAVREIKSLNGTMIPVDCEIKTITFAAHADFPGTKSFVDQLKPKNIVFVHGEKEQMRKLSTELERDAKSRNTETKFFRPDNGQTVTLRFQEQRIVRAYGGELVQRKMRTNGTRVAAYLVRRNFTDRLIATDDLRMYTQLKTARVSQKLSMPFHRTFDDLCECVGRVFDSKRDPGSSKLVVKDSIELYLSKNLVTMSWDASPTTDMIADSLTAILMQAEGGIPAVRIGTCCSTHAHHAIHAIQEDHEKGMTEDVLASSETAKVLCNLLEERFGQENVTKEADAIKVSDEGRFPVSVSFDSNGHVIAITRDGDDAMREDAQPDPGAAFEASIRQLVALTSQTVHVLF